MKRSRRLTSQNDLHAIKKGRGNDDEGNEFRNSCI